MFDLLNLDEWGFTREFDVFGKNEHRCTQMNTDGLSVFDLLNLDEWGFTREFDVFGKNELNTHSPEIEP
ncbi:hypothetical protein NIES592_19620 [Fischerella major NIES-592]|uniref:Uncharacterized protein n=1 Tax=Fischerella major NIES-592 TaxID=210994 RepID=A0A1U7GUW9_9CYAN|nr:hypothetical protein NIES592_19620 [Fischerella major NIES-592]